MRRVRIIMLAGIFFLLQTGTTMASNRIETQAFTLIQKEKEFEIRYYPPAVLATVYSTADSYREISGTGFRRLAGYIFGGNKKGTKIAMTSPVHMDINEERSSMSFVMPSAYHSGNLPEPNDPGVVVEESDAEYVAVIRFGGYASDRSIRRYSAKLEAALREKGIETVGNFRYLGYNPPYQLFGRKNEIIVTVIRESVE
jgi:hypothetical protein